MALDPAALDALRLDHAGAAAPRPGLLRRWRAWLIAAALVLLALGFFALRSPPLVIETVAAEAPTGSGRAAVLNASGYVVARRIATVASKVTGRVVEVDVDEGATVHAGQVLARLDPTTVHAAWEVAARQLDAARLNEREIEVRLVDARHTLERVREIRRRELVAQSVFDSAEADGNALAARLEAARGEAAVAASTLRARAQDLDDLVIRAPFDGVAISKDAQAGEMVSPISAGGGFTRTGIATIVDMASRELEVDVNEAFINRVLPGQPVEATLDAYPGEVLPARVLKIVPTADRQKATVKVRIGLDQLEPRILPDMGVKVRFLGPAAPDGARPVALVPASAVQHDGARAYTWVVESDRLVRRELRVAAGAAELVGVLAGLRPGELVVARSVAGLKAGARVTRKGT